MACQAVLRIGVADVGALRSMSDSMAEKRSKTGAGRGTCFFRIGLGGNYFPSFDEGDFDGGVTVKTDGGEFTFALIAGFDFSH